MPITYTTHTPTYTHIHAYFSICAIATYFTYIFRAHIIIIIIIIINNNNIIIIRTYIIYIRTYLIYTHAHIHIHITTATLSFISLYFDFFLHIQPIIPLTTTRSRSISTTNRCRSLFWKMCFAISDCEKRCEKWVAEDVRRVLGVWKRERECFVLS
jgi:hypothetical protein